MRGLVYFDASAFLKLLLVEPESAALRTEASTWSEWISSSLLTVEVGRAIRRAAGALRAPDSELLTQRADAMLGRVALFDMDVPILAGAKRVDPLEMRSLDAIHIATALAISGELDAVATYDRRLADAARTAGLPVLSPA